MSLSSPGVRSAAFVLALATPMAGLLAGQALAAGPVKVAIKGFAFVPQVVTVTPGTTVTWTNADEDPHTVVANDKGFRSAALDSDDSYSFTFTKPGDYAYFCSLHPHMTGKVVVR